MATIKVSEIDLRYIIWSLRRVGQHEAEVIADRIQRQNSRVFGR